MFESFFAELGLAAIARVWNKILLGSAREANGCTTESAKGTIRKGDTRTRNAMKHYLGDRWDQFTVIDGGCIEPKVKDPTAGPAPGSAISVTDRPATTPAFDKMMSDFDRQASGKTRPGMNAPAQNRTVEPPKPKLSPMEQTIMMAATRQGSVTATAVETISPALNAQDVEALLAAADEADRETRANSDFVVAMCRRADEQLIDLVKKTGDAQWAEPITVEKVQGTDGFTRHIIFVRSATSPLFGTHGPIVKHDFRADGKPVNVNHEAMFKQLDGLKLVRSKVFTSKVREYYVKGLNYRDGMRFKGYFVIDGTEQPNLARYYQVRGGAVVTITEEQYRDLENRAAGKYADKK